MDESLTFKTAKAFETWLARNHAKSDGVWLRIAKKGSGETSVSHAEALDVALCYGWIDALRRSCDDAWFLQRFTPRTRKSIWSKINREKVLALIEAGRMKEAGLKEIERAKADGRWDRAYAGQRTAEVPPDLAAALKKNRAALAFFETLDSKNRYAVLFRIGNAKKEETRARRIATFVEMLAKGEKIYP
ncbi:MAG TPA: YdeI/OmpD-associated family protein [Thermoanaerobaculia bacterium]|nr:YdeI/OmpD-associated family protein [Thermoanaerobaculia bacterium]